MRFGVLVCFLFLASSGIFAQNWSAYPPGQLITPYVNGLMTATVTKVNTTMNSGTPMYTTSTSPDCYIAAGCLALNAGFFNSYLANSSRIQVDLDFTSGGNNGTCNSAAWTIRDINSGESFTDFLDVVEISAIDGNNVAIPAANIVVTPPVQVTVVTVGNVKKIVGHNSASEVTTGGPYSSTPCNLTSVSVSPPANTPLKSIRIVYRPGVGTSSANAYYSVGTHPAVQYISLSNLTMTPTGGGCTVLSEELQSFEGHSDEAVNVITWAAKTGFQGMGFLLEKSADGTSFSTLGTMEANETEYFSLQDPQPFPETFYRLSQWDKNGVTNVLGTVSVRRADQQNRLFELAPNPANDLTTLHTLLQGENLLTILDASGKQVWSQDFIGQSTSVIDVSALPDGLYVVKMRNQGNSECRKLIVRH